MLQVGQRRVAEKDGHKMELFCLKSFINHDIKQNLKLEYGQPNIVFMYANRDIKAGEELLIDYCNGE